MDGVYLIAAGRRSGKWSRQLNWLRACWLRGQTTAMMSARRMYVSSSRTR
jgi:hypothetical protein